ncbi:unnamed protein product [Amoebophrya sp. A120]|nr:unnamed protein product [Amoebophrya sp. A120]|eukprot:GSA120T00021674001.1
MNEAIQSFATSALEYVPESVKDVTGLQKQMVEEVDHISDVLLERLAFVDEHVPEMFLTLCYLDGFQIWRIVEENGKELVSWWQPPSSGHQIARVKLLPLNPDCLFSKVPEVFEGEGGTDASAAVTWPRPAGREGENAEEEPLDHQQHQGHDQQDQDQEAAASCGVEEPQVVDRDDEEPDQVTPQQSDVAAAGAEDNARAPLYGKASSGAPGQPAMSLQCKRRKEASPLVAFVTSEGTKIHIFSLRENESVYVLRSVRAVLSLQATKRLLAAGLSSQIDLYDARDFSHLFQVGTAPAPLSSLGNFCLGDRWLAYDLSGTSLASKTEQPPAHGALSSQNNTAGDPSAGTTEGSGFEVNSARSKVQSYTNAVVDGSFAAVRDGISLLGQISQKTLDSFLMNSDEILEHRAALQLQQPGGAAPGKGVLGRGATGGGAGGAGGTYNFYGPNRLGAGFGVAVRDCVGRHLIGQFATQEPIECMRWNSSGTLLISCTAMAHNVLLHRVIVEKNRTTGAKVHRFVHAFTLSRGITPALISNLTISEDSRVVAVSTKKGTTHIYLLPPTVALPVSRTAAPAEGDRGGGAIIPGGDNFCTPSGGSAASTGSVVFNNPAAGGSPQKSAAVASSCSSSATNASGTTLVSAASSSSSATVLQAVTRIKLGSAWLQEGLQPVCLFAETAKHSVRTLCIATRAGIFSIFSLRFLSAPESSVAETAKNPARGRTSFWGRKWSSTCASSAEKDAGQQDEEATCFVQQTKSMGAYRPKTNFVQKAYEAAPAWAEEGPSEPGSRDPVVFRKRHVPIWFSPQLSFYTFPRQKNGADDLLMGEKPGSRTRLTFAHTEPGCEARLGNTTEEPRNLFPPEEGDEEHEEYCFVPDHN